jgi:5,10-methylenetetrahydromethanopterin reductase
VATVSAMDISCSFATAMDTPEWIALAEELGYKRAWCYDSPAIYPDVWMILSRAAERTSHIGLGPAVLVPSLRHPMVNAAAIVTLAAQAPGRVAVAVGAGYTGRLMMGQSPMRWADVEAYVRVLRTLLRGEDAEWDGATIRMMHPEGFGAGRPVDVPMLIGAAGPKGMAAAAELGDGVMFGGVACPWPDGVERLVLLWVGTVLEEGESADSDRVWAAAGHGVMAAYHSAFERGGAQAVDQLPGGITWRTTIEAAPVAVRHLALHEGHLIAPSRADELIREEASSLIPSITVTGTAAEVGQRLKEYEAAGITEFCYQPSGPDIRRELKQLVDYPTLTSGDRHGQPTVGYPLIEEPRPCRSTFSRSTTRSTVYGGSSPRAAALARPRRRRRRKASAASWTRSTSRSAEPTCSRSPTYLTTPRPLPWHLPSPPVEGPPFARSFS